MNVDRMARVNSLLKREIGAVVLRMLHEASMDASAVTVVEVIASRDLQNARVRVSIRDDQQQRQPILSFLRRRHSSIQEEVSRAVVLKYTPRLSFEIDHSIEKGDRVLDILARMPPLEDTPESPEPGPTEGDQPECP